MSKLILVYFFILCFGCNSSPAQKGPGKADTLLIGTWKGSSICQLKNSPCHDETNVYHISKNKADDTFYVDAGKIVDGVEESMGVLPFIYNDKTNQFTSTAHGIWTFNVEGDKLEGTLLVNGDLYRKIMLKKTY